MITHYWSNRPYEIDNYDALCADVDLIQAYCEKKGVKLTGFDAESNDYREGAPLYNESRIAFNGLEDESCESLVMQRVADRSEAFMFCKTWREPYDLAVCLVLLRMKAIVPDFEFDSDGNLRTEPEWIEAKRSYRALFGRRHPRSDRQRGVEMSQYQAGDLIRHSAGRAFRLREDPYRSSVQSRR